MPISSSIVPELRTELELLERKVAVVKAMLELYGDDARMPASTVAETNPAPGAVPADHRPPVRKPSESTTTIRRTARDLITANDRRPVPTRDVIAAVKREGVAIPGLNELSAVSAILSRSPDFNNVDKMGWVLADNGSA